MEECPICFEALTLLSNIVCTPCRHIFHQLCISRLLRFGATATEDSTISCPLCRADLPTDISAFTPVSSGLPEGETVELSGQDAEYRNEGQLPRNENANNRSIFSSLQLFIRGIIHHRVEGRNARISVTERDGDMDHFFRTSFTQFRLDFVQRQADLDIRTHMYEHFLLRRGGDEGFADVLAQQSDDILHEHFQLRWDYRHVRMIVTRQRRFIDTRRRVLQAWDSAWPRDDRMQFEQLQRLLLIRVESLRHMRFPRERLENLD